MRLQKIRIFFTTLDRDIVTLLRKATFEKIAIEGKEYYALDIDVTPFCNPKVKKEGNSRTYKRIDGFAPIMAYFCSYALCFDLRPGSQHSENQAPEFLRRCMAMISELDIAPEDVLLRVDSGHDAAAFIKEAFMI